MRRRRFLTGAVAVAGACALPGRNEGAELRTPTGQTATVPSLLAGMRLAELRDDYRDRLFRQYLPFWEKGGYDRQYGGFLCELNDDGSVAGDEKHLWYQGRAIWGLLVPVQPLRPRPTVAGRCPTHAPVRARPHGCRPGALV